ncbi:MAG: SMI1/KNR4 family protein [Lachnospiraceae bacterium]|nr:SMI1/KNR4 family protein [Lachnospiraceae bacterium]
MAIKYDLSAIDMIKLLGCKEPVGREDWEDIRKRYTPSLPMDKTRLESFQEEYHQTIPPMLYEFLRLANDHPLFETADIWAAGSCLLYFSYEDIEERIEEDRDYWEETPEDREEDEYYQFSQIPKEQWKEFVLNHLYIGSDYAAGVVNFGICETDLDQENPPVYYLHEADSIKDWKVIADTLSDFLGGIVCDMLAGAEYTTAQDYLEEEDGGWEFSESGYNSEEELRKQLAQQQIDLSAMKKYSSFYGEEDSYRCCADEETGTMYLAKNGKELLVIQKVEYL